MKRPDDETTEEAPDVDPTPEELEQLEQDLDDGEEDT